MSYKVCHFLIGMDRPQLGEVNFIWTIRSKNLETMVYKIDMQYSNFFYCFFVEVIEKPKWVKFWGEIIWKKVLKKGYISWQCNWCMRVSLKKFHNKSRSKPWLCVTLGRDMPLLGWGFCIGYINRLRKASKVTLKWGRLCFSLRMFLRILKKYNLFILFYIMICYHLLHYRE